VVWRGDPLELVGFRRRRIAWLLRHDINLIAYHLPLDRHPELGHNALAARALGLVELTGRGDHEGVSLGFGGRFPEPIDGTELARRCEQVFAQAPLVLGNADRPVGSLGIVSGGAQRMFHDAIDQGLDAYVTGEASEWVQSVARETGTLYLAAGHHATERLGIRALGDHLAERFGLEVEFFDVPNPV
jgi:dinuclear metal center YbgI/SA1388 family protein